MRITTLLALILTTAVRAEDATPFSGSWRVVEESHPHTATKEGIELGLKQLDFRKNNRCIFVFKSPKDENVSREIDRRFVAGFKELALIGGDDLKHASVEIYQWHKDGENLILVQEAVVGGPDSPPPDTKDMNELEADLATKLSKVPKKLTIRITLTREAEDGADQPANAPESKREGEEKPKTESPKPKWSGGPPRGWTALESSLEQCVARNPGRPIIVSFGATWVILTQLNWQTLSMDGVTEVLQRAGLVCISADLTHENPLARDEMERLHRAAVPVTAIYDPTTRKWEVKQDIFTAENVNEWVESLRQRIAEQDGRSGGDKPSN